MTAATAAVTGYGARLRVGRAVRPRLRRAVPSREVGRRGPARAPRIHRGRVVSAPAQDTFARRLIGCLDVRAGRVVKGVNFEGLRDAGDPPALAARYDAEGIDELVLLDVTATAEDRLALARTVSDVAARVFIPLAVGGGIRSVEDAAGVIDAGADKVAINTAALGDPALITRIAGRFGSQAVVVAIDAKREGGRFAVRSHAGRTPTALGGRRLGPRGRGAGRRRDPAHLHRRRRHAARVRLPADQRGVGCGGHPRDRVGGSGRSGSFRRGLHGRARRRRPGRVHFSRPHVQRAGRQGAAPRRRAARPAVRRHADSLD